jgi:hypothetical protein
LKFYVHGNKVWLRSEDSDHQRIIWVWDNGGYQGKSYLIQHMRTYLPHDVYPMHYFEDDIESQIVSIRENFDRMDRTNIHLRIHAEQ